MFNWKDRVYINARKRVFKNLDTNEMLNLEIQEDADNIITESDTPLSAYCLNQAQQELVDDMSKTYRGTNITADTVAGVGRINKVYGKTTETGTGDKSPSNPYVLKCVGDDVNLFDINSHIEFTDGYRDYTHGNKMSSTIFCGLKIPVQQNQQYIISTDVVRAQFSNLCYFDKNMTLISADSFTGSTLFITPTNCAYVTLAINKNLKWLKLQKGSMVTPWSPYGYGTVEVISKNGSNTSSNIVATKPLCSIGDIKDEIDYVKGKITKRLDKMTLSGAENWILAETHDNMARFVFYLNALKNASKFMCDKFRVVKQSALQASDIDTICERDLSVDNGISILINTSRLSSLDVNGFKTFLASNPTTIVYELATPIVKEIDCSNKIAQYDEQTIVYNRDGAEIEVSLTNNKAISEVNIDLDNVEERLNEIVVDEKEPITKKKVWFKKTKNLFNKQNIISGYEIVSSTGGVTAKADYFVSDYIPVIENEVYIFSGKTVGTNNCFYDKNHNFICSVPQIVGQLKIPQNAVYMRFNGAMAQLNTIQFEKGAIATSYEEYKNSIYILNESNNYEFFI